VDGRVPDSNASSIHELVYILPDTTEEQVAELHQQIEAVVWMSGQIEPDGKLGAPAGA
jgi:hypothetical protein